MIKDLNIEVVRKDLKIRGYAFVKLEDEFINKVNECAQLMMNFFNTKDKESYFREPVFGYFNVPHKEVFRFQTGNMIHVQSFPNEQIKALGLMIDNNISSIVELLFPGITEALNHQVPFNQWGLLDVVLYHNLNRKKLNIVEHYDPGVLTFSFKSSSPGLELRNEHGEWISPPYDMGILWTGHAIRSYDAEHPEGIHRVQKGLQPRMAIWYEIGTYLQDRSDMLNNYTGYQYEIDLMKKEGYHPVRQNNNIIGYENNGNTLIGFKALESITTGSNKVAVGNYTLNNTMIGNNVAIGSKALKK